MSDNTEQGPNLAMAGEAEGASANEGSPKSTLRARMLALLDQLEKASPFESARIAEQVRLQAGQIRALRRGHT